MNEEAKGKSDRIEPSRRWEPIESLKTPHVSERIVLDPLALEATEAKTDEAKESASGQLKRFQRQLEHYTDADSGKVNIDKVVSDLKDQTDKVKSKTGADMLRADYHYANGVRDKINGRREPMTGLFNRQGLLEALWEFMEHPDRFIKNGAKYVIGKPIGIMLLDIDGLKEVNDVHGHHIGDRVIRAFGKVLGEQLRDADMAARWGGDEFWALLPGIAQTEARTANDRVATAMEKISVEGKDGKDVKVGFSTGSAVFEWKHLYGVLEAYKRGNRQPLEDEVVAILSKQLAKSKKAEGKRRYTGVTGDLPSLSDQEGEN
jgi:diguanylate cyclase (GGDEF)-like protein